MSKYDNTRQASGSFVGRMWNRIVEARTRQAEQQIRQYTRHWE